MSIDRPHPGSITTPATTTPSKMSSSQVAALQFGVVDIETTGLRIDRHRIVQLGLAIVAVTDAADADGQGGAHAVTVDQWSTLVRLRWPWQRVGPRHVHGISRRDLRGAPDVAEALGELEVRLRGSIFTAHNAAFDGGFLERAARLAGVPLELGPRLCTLRMSRSLDPERQQSHRLGDVCARYGVALDRPHDALHDALATAAILPHLLREHGVTRADELEPFYDRRSSVAPSRWWRAGGRR